MKWECEQFALQVKHRRQWNAFLNDNYGSLWQFFGNSSFECLFVFHSQYCVVRVRFSIFLMLFSVYQNVDRLFRQCFFTTIFYDLVLHIFKNLEYLWVGLWCQWLLLFLLCLWWNNNGIDLRLRRFQGYWLRKRLNCKGIWGVWCKSIINRTTGSWRRKMVESLKSKDGRSTRPKVFMMNRLLSWDRGSSWQKSSSNDFKVSWSH